MLTKTVTLPDAFVIDPETKKTAHVEVTNGRGCNEHKEAQMRVVLEAGIVNYFMLTGDEVKKLGEVPEVDRYTALCQLFKWTRES